MTNWEKFKEGLTAKAFYEMREAICFLFNRSWPCAQCPAREYCDRCHGKNSCKDIFTRWAKAKVKEEK